MFSVFTIIYAALALAGGWLGASLSKASVQSGVIASGAGFIASCVAQLAGAQIAGAVAAFAIVLVVVSAIVRLKPAQIAAVLVATFIVSGAGAFIVGFIGGFERGFSHAWTHAEKK
ncbi:hypothetical protein [Aquabacter cavernae]|uniref:hypothetical protein n=1 Tax=Aquabacter cavernae TaxID=2496029 RepID=UPI000F8E18D4|nr:hypothetical protein [Aquabacter cavernae]